MSLLVAFQMDALERLNLRTDSTLYMARRAAWHGCKMFHYEPSQLRLLIANDTVKVLASGHDLQFNEKNEKPWSLGSNYTLDLSTCDAILMRQDPPFDLAYITATHILDHIKDKVRIVNDPTGVREAPEKILLTRFPQLTAPTLITRDMNAIEAFRAQHGDIVIKPIYSFGGHGVFHLNEQDGNLPALVEMMAGLNNEPWIVQKFLQVNALGDKRIILLDGEPVGHFRRMPQKGEPRSNMRVGGKTEAAPLTTRDRLIIETIAPTLKNMGLRLVGLDVIGDYLTEINVTSPTGLVTADQFAGREGKDSIPEMFWQKVLSTSAGPARKRRKTDGPV